MSAAALCGALALGACRDARDSAPPCAQPLMVATYNIRFDNPEDGVHRWANRVDAVVAQTRALEADLLAMQEVLPNQLAALEHALPGYRREGEGRDGPGQGEGSPLFYRDARFERLDGGTVWLSPTPDRPRGPDEQKPWGTWLNRIASWALLRERQHGKRVLAISTHFDHVSETARQNSAALLVDFIPRHPADVVVLLGDLNARPGSEPHQRLAAALTDAARAPEVVRPPSRTTVTRWTELGPPEHHIDHIFTSGARPLRYEVVDRRADYQGAARYPSDHLPVRARLCLD